MKPEFYLELDAAIIKAVDAGHKTTKQINPVVEEQARTLTKWHPHYLIRQRLLFMKNNGQLKYESEHGWSAL